MNNYASRNEQAGAWQTGHRRKRRHETVESAQQQIASLSAAGKLKVGVRPYECRFGDSWSDGQVHKAHWHIGVRGGHGGRLTTNDETGAAS